MAMLVTVLRILAASVGSLALYIRLFMYEDEEGKWQNRIDNLWIDIHDRERTAGSKTSASFWTSFWHSDASKTQSGLIRSQPHHPSVNLNHRGYNTH